VVTVVLTAPVSFAGCDVPLTPWLASAPSGGGCGELLWVNLIPGSLWTLTSCRCDGLPAWLSQLVRRAWAGFPKFLSALSSRATLCDPGRPSGPSPVADWLVLGSVNGDSVPACVYAPSRGCMA
jgi:hypothetical protein